ncbi:MAG: pentapeptide repeat-containing protein [Myxococcota bacterium]|nr:pentapeptide repeat-containing protein [Myxococcota bacterium]
MATLSPSGGARPGAWLAIASGYALLIAALYGHVLAHEAYFDRDDFTWISGTTLGNAWRWTQWAVLHEICLPLFGANRTGYYLPSLVLHWVDSLAVAWLFVELQGSMRGDRGRPRGTRLAGGGLAGLLFLLYDSGAPRWISALSYQLVTLAALAMLIAALRYLRSGRTGWWAAAVAAYAFGLASHSYALLLPVFVLAVEAVARRGGGQGSGRWWPGAALRYGAFALPLGIFMALFGRSLSARAAEVGASNGLGEYLLQYLKYVWISGLHFWGSPLHAYQVDPRWNGWTVAALVGLLALAAAGGRDLLRNRGRIGLLGTAALFGLAWFGLSIVQTLGTAHNLSSGWRYYFNAVGVALVAGQLALAALTRLCRALPGLSPVRLLAAVALALALGIALGKPAGRAGLTFWGRTLAGETNFDQRLWDADDLCPERVRLSADEALSRGRDGGDLSCAVVRNRSLRDAEWSGSDLRGIDLTASDLTASSLTGANLRGAGLIWADLVQADLSRADLTDANLSGADLSYADLRGARLDRTVLNGAVLFGSLHDSTAFATTHLCNADLRELDLGGYQLAGVPLREVLILRTGLAGADLRGADLHKADGQQVDLTGADLQDAILRKAYLPGVILENADLRGADLTWCTLTGADLRGADLRGAIMEGTDLAGADLTGADLTGALDDRALYDGATLTGVKR